MRRLRDDFLAVPRPRRSIFAWTLTIGWIGAALATGAMAWAAQAPLAGWLAAREADWLTWAIAAAPFDHSMAVFLESPGNGVVLIPLTLVVAALFVRARQPLLALAVLAASLMAALVVLGAWTITPRPRPDFLYPDLPPSGLSAFPSGHLSIGIPFYGLLAWLWYCRAAGPLERVFVVGIVVAGLATVALARVVLGAHWPSDLVAGTLLGGFWLAVVIHALRAAGVEAAGRSRPRWPATHPAGTG